MRSPIERIAVALERIADAFDRRPPVLARAKALNVEPLVVAPPPPLRAARAPKAPPATNGSWTPGRCERAILGALMQRHPKPCTRAQVAILSGYSVTSGGFANSLGALRTHGLIEGSGELRLTSAGYSAAPEMPRTPGSGPALVAMWMQKLGKCERAILETLTRYGHKFGRDELAVRAGYSATSGGYANALGRLRTLELIEGRGEIKASPELLA
jgi:hypothetical protein